jgi:peptidoglycan endopeptidase LytF
MEGGRARSLRLLAPAAVGLFALLALIIVVSSSGVSGGLQQSADDTGDRASERAERRRARSRRSGRATYTVKTGDTLGSISRKNDTSIDRIQELNPQLDPQTLATGQRIKLR